MMAFDSAAVLVIDLQQDYISGGDLVEGQTSPLLQAFPELPKNVETMLASARAAGIPVVHVREVDAVEDSVWLQWWNKLHSPTNGENHVGAGVRATAEPWAAEQGDEQVLSVMMMFQLVVSLTRLSVWTGVYQAHLRRIQFRGGLRAIGQAPPRRVRGDATPLRRGVDQGVCHVQREHCFHARI